MRDLLLLLVSDEFNLIHRSKQYDRVGDLDKLRSGRLVMQSIIAIGITFSCSPLLFGVENVGLSVNVGSLWWAIGGRGGWVGWVGGLGSNGSGE
jgi:hypothetical protein